MKTNASMSVTVTLNAEDLVELYEEGELSNGEVVIGTPDPELERFKQLSEKRLEYHEKVRTIKELAKKVESGMGWNKEEKQEFLDQFDFDDE